MGMKVVFLWSCLLGILIFVDTIHKRRAVIYFNAQYIKYNNTDYEYHINNNSHSGGLLYAVYIRCKILDIKSHTRTAVEVLKLNSPNSRFVVPKNKQIHARTHACTHARERKNPNSLYIFLYLETNVQGHFDGVNRRRPFKHLCFSKRYQTGASAGRLCIGKTSSDRNYFKMHRASRMYK